MRFASFVFITLAAVPAACVDQNSDEPEAAVASKIESANRTFEETFARGDADGMAALYTEDGQLLPTGSDVISGRSAIADFWQGAFDAGLARAELTTVELESAGDAAYEVGRYRLSLEDGQVADEGKYVVVWKREDGHWKLHRDIWNTSNAPSESAEPEGAMLTPADLQWTEMFPGVSFAPVYGDWSVEGHGKFVRFESGVEAPVHTHTNAYHGVVISGRLTNPYPDEADAPEMGPGTYWLVPGGAAHGNACVSEEPCLFYTYGDAAWDIAIVEE